MRLYKTCYGYYGTTSAACGFDEESDQAFIAMAETSSWDPIKILWIGFAY